MNSFIPSSLTVDAPRSRARVPGTLAALALVLGAVTVPASAAVLYSQLDDASGNGSPVQIFEPAFTAYDSMGADDFMVTGEGWNINEVGLAISFTAGAEPADVNISFYGNDGGLPGNLLQQFLAAPFAGGVASLGAGIDLTPGTYWMGVVFERDFVTGGQVFWSNRSTQSGFAGAWQNPGNGFGSGCTTWAPQTVCGVGGGVSPDFLFELSGDRLTNQIPEPASLALVLAALAGVSLSRRRRG